MAIATINGYLPDGRIYAARKNPNILQAAEGTVTNKRKFHLALGTLAILESALERHDVISIAGKDSQYGADIKTAVGVEKIYLREQVAAELGGVLTNVLTTFMGTSLRPEQIEATVTALTSFEPTPDLIPKQGP